MLYNYPDDVLDEIIGSLEYYGEAKPMSKTQVKKCGVKKEVYQAQFPTTPSPCVTTAYEASKNWSSLVPCTSPEEDCISCNKEEETMNGYSKEAEATQYLTSRLLTAYYKVENKLGYDFGLHDYDEPLTARALVERITSGKFQLPSPERDEHNHGLYDALLSIRWRDPAVKEDRPGHDAAIKLLSSDRVAVKDQIQVGTLAEGLKALQDFEAKYAN